MTDPLQDTTNSHGEVHQLIKAMTQDLPPIQNEIKPMGPLTAAFKNQAEYTEQQSWWRRFLTGFSLVTGIRTLGSPLLHPLRKDNRYDGIFWCAVFIMLKLIALGRAVGDPAWDVVVLTADGTLVLPAESFEGMLNGNIYGLDVTGNSTVKRFVEKMNWIRQETNPWLAMDDGTLTALLNRLSGGIFQPVNGLGSTGIICYSIATTIASIQVLMIMLIANIQHNSSAVVVNGLRQLEKFLTSIAKSGKGGKINRVHLNGFMITFLLFTFMSDILIWVCFALYVNRSRPSTAHVWLDVSEIVVNWNGTSWVGLPEGSNPVLLDYGIQPVLRGNGFYAAIGAVAFSVLAILCLIWQYVVLWIIGKKLFDKLKKRGETFKMDGDTVMEDVIQSDGERHGDVTVQETELALEKGDDAQKMVMSRFKQAVRENSSVVAHYIVLVPRSRRKLLLAFGLMVVMLLVGSGAFMGLSFIGTNQSFWPNYPAYGWMPGQEVNVIVPLPYDPWTFSEAYFFVLTTCLVIGYGNIVPGTTASRAFLLFYGTLSIGISGNFIVAIRDFLVIRAQRQALGSVLVLKTEQMRREVKKAKQASTASTNETSGGGQNGSSHSIWFHWKTGHKQSEVVVPTPDTLDTTDTLASNAEDAAADVAAELDDDQVQDLSKDATKTDPKDTKMMHVFLIVRLVLTLLTYWMLGALFFTLTEPGWDFFTSVYFLYVSSTTLGYGDIVPTTPAGWELLGVWILLIIPIFALLLSGVQDVVEWSSALGKANRQKESLEEEQRRVAEKLKEWSATSSNEAS